MKVIYATIMDEILEAKRKADCKGKTIKCIKLNDREISDLWQHVRITMSDMVITDMLAGRKGRTLDEFTRACDRGSVKMFGVCLQSMAV